MYRTQSDNGVVVYAPERQQAILLKARQAGRVDVTRVAIELDVTPETVRRDLSALERRGLVRRVHGGAIPIERLGVEPALADREGQLIAEKKRIGAAALAELPDGGSILLDGGTTTAALAAQLPTDRELTVVTHALPVASIVASRPNITLHLVGGTVRGRTLAAVGEWALRDLREIQTEVAFVGTNGLTPEHGITTPDMAEANVKRAVVNAGRRIVVLTDHTKVGRVDLFKVAPLREVDVVITDDGLDPDLADQLGAAGPTVVTA